MACFCSKSQGGPYRTLLWDGRNNQCLESGRSSRAKTFCETPISSVASSKKFEEDLFECIALSKSLGIVCIWMPEPQEASTRLQQCQGTKTCY